eukprot:2538233-Pyramimonas_sp.AAC.1
MSAENWRLSSPPVSLPLKSIQTLARRPSPWSGPVRAAPGAPRAGMTRGAVVVLSLPALHPSSGPSTL